MFGLLLLIYVNTESSLNKYVYDIFKAEVATGIMNTVGNKGSVAVSLKIHETRICFVCSHFAADTERVIKRNSDYLNTKQRLRFEYNANLDYYDLEEAHDLIFWFGDLNYRLDASLGLVNAINLINSSSFEELLENDQLFNEKKKGIIFENYNEGKINFRPTYKYLLREDKYARQDLIRSSLNPLELPCDRIAYTDRILWRSAPDLNVDLIQYSCINTITISDHKPVYALFDIEVKRLNIDDYNRKYDEWLKDTDKRQNDEMPHIRASALDYKFSDCSFYDQKSFDFTIENKGQRLSNVGIRFYEPSSIKDNNTESRDIKIKQSSKVKPSQWVEINPHVKERLGPGSEYRVELKTNLSYNNLKRLNKNPKVDDFLIISCLNGNDLFFTVSLEYKRTIIGYSLKALSTLKKDQSLYDANLNALSQDIESKIEEFENLLDRLFFEKLNFISKENAELKLKTMVSNKKTSQDDRETLHYLDKVEIYKHCMISLTEELVTDDPYFQNELSAEYLFLMQHLLERCDKKVNVLKQERTCVRDAVYMPFETQKNKILNLLSAKSFDEFLKENFEMDILTEVLKDLLVSLPSSLIPIRYLDYLMYVDNQYKEALFLLDFLPRSHLKLFNEIIKFLQIYPKSLSTTNTDYIFIIANAIFKINFNIKNIYESSSNNQPGDMNSHRSKIAHKVLELFIRNH